MAEDVENWMQRRRKSGSFARRLKRLRDPIGIAFQLRTRPNPESEYRKDPYLSACGDNDLGRLALTHDGLPFTKSWHYFDFYDRHLGGLAVESRDGKRSKPIRILEIGVWKGGSLQLWRKYFGQSAMIVGIDIDEACLELPEVGAVVRIGSQVDEEFLMTVVDEMGGVDIVIDDGSHQCAHVIKTFQTLFPLLAENGFYFVEDLHTSYWPQWQGGLRRPGSSIEFFKDLVDVVNSDSFRSNPLRGEEFDATRDVLSLEFGDSLVLVRKGSRQKAQILYGGVHDPKYLAAWSASAADWAGRSGN